MAGERAILCVIHWIESIRVTVHLLLSLLRFTVSKVSEPVASSESMAEALDWRVKVSESMEVAVIDQTSEMDKNAARPSIAVTRGSVRVA